MKNIEFFLGSINKCYVFDSDKNNSTKLPFNDKTNKKYFNLPIKFLKGDFNLKTQ